MSRSFSTLQLHTLEDTFSCLLHFTREKTKVCKDDVVTVFLHNYFNTKVRQSSNQISLLEVVEWTFLVSSRDYSSSFIGTAFYEVAGRIPIACLLLPSAAAMESSKKTNLSSAAIGLIAAAAAGIIAYYFVLRKPKKVTITINQRISVVLMFNFRRI